MKDDKNGITWIDNIMCTLIVILLFAGLALLIIPAFVMVWFPSAICMKLIYTGLVSLGSFFAIGLFYGLYLHLEDF